MKYWMAHFLMVVASFRLFAGEDRPPGLGSGGPGLRIIWNATNQYIVFNDLTYLQSFREKADWLPPKRQIQVLIERNFDVQALTEWHRRFGTFIGDEEDPYPFDEETAFTCFEASKSGSNSDTNGWPRTTRVYSINNSNGEIVLAPRDVYALARSRYGLTTNQLFLGKIGTNIFYFEKHDVRKVYYRTTTESQARHYFKLPRNVVDLDGVTRAAENTNKDVAVCVTVPLGWFDWFDPAAFHVRDCEFSFREAKKVRTR